MAGVFFEVTPALLSVEQVILRKIAGFTPASFFGGDFSFIKLAQAWYWLRLVLRNAETPAAIRLRREKGD